MCVVSMIGDHYRDLWKDRDYTAPLYPWPNMTLPATSPSQQEFDQLKKEVKELEKLLVRAKKYDEDNGEPNCEMDEKVAFLKKMAGMVGVDLNDIFPK